MGISPHSRLHSEDKFWEGLPLDPTVIEGTRSTYGLDYKLEYDRKCKALAARMCVQTETLQKSRKRNAAP